MPELFFIARDNSLIFESKEPGRVVTLSDYDNWVDHAGNNIVSASGDQFVFASSSNAVTTNSIIFKKRNFTIPFLIK
jgi:hypothetical protein